MRRILIFITLIFIFYSCDDRINKKYPLNDSYFLKTSTKPSNGYTWTYLCNKKTGECVNFYGKDTYTGRIENIQIEKVVNDTAIFVTFYKGFKNCRYKEDTLILSEARLLSKSVEKDCPRKIY